MTMWGIVMTTLSAVLPTIGPILGLNITAELVQQLGDQIIIVVQAAGALVGTLLTIYGRVRASAPLSATK
jgi:energy-converting hydrogenase Eha subunit A